MTFQGHIKDFLIREHHYRMLDQADITDSKNFFAEDHLWAFIKDTQQEKLNKLIEDYGTDTRNEFFHSLHSELKHTPLWLIIRQGLNVRGHIFHLYYAKPRSIESVGVRLYEKNHITFRQHFYFGETNKEIDFVFFLNGLPIVVLELKHEKNQTVHDGVAQFVERDQSLKIFQHPFLYVVADTGDVKAATNPSHEENFRWHNMGLTNVPQTEGEYPVEFLYREVLSKEHLIEALAFFLVYVPKPENKDNVTERSSFTLFPRYHQSRMVRKVSRAALEKFETTGNIGGKYLINHSAGSGKTLSICWLADKLHSLFNPMTGAKLVDMVFIMTDRRSLDKNIKDEIENFIHLKDIIGIAKTSEQLHGFLRKKTSIVVTTQQKFQWILEEIRDDPSLKNMRVAFLIDEAHRSQEGKMGMAIRVPFREPDDPDIDDAAEYEQNEEDQIVKIIQEYDPKQLFVAFTATPSPATATLFGDPYDTYSEVEAIAEGYIVDVATSIISYKTLYHLHCPIVPSPEEENLYPKGIIAKALKNVAFQDMELIQYKAEVMLRIFNQNVKNLIDGRAKTMIVTSSRIAGLRYFQIIKEKLKERKADYNVLFAFTDFTHPETNETFSEHSINELKEGEEVEDRFEGNDYRIIVVANKFQTGFDQPLLAGMFIDKPVMDRNAVQTLSRLNRSYPGKHDVVVVDFTNNADKILKAFARYRKGISFETSEPENQQCIMLYNDIMAIGVFTQVDANALINLSGSDSQLQLFVNGLRTRLREQIIDLDERKSYVSLLARFVKSFNFLTLFFTYPLHIREFADFAEYICPQLIKEGPVSDLMKQIRATNVVKASVQLIGEVNAPSVESIKIKSSIGRKGIGQAPKKASVQEMITDIRSKFDISDEEALYIKEVTEEKVNDSEIRATVHANKDDLIYLEGIFQKQVNGQIQSSYAQRGRYYELGDEKYIDVGAIFDIMAVTIIHHHINAVSKLPIE